MSRLPAPLHRLGRRRSGDADDPRRGILITGGGTAGHTNPGIAVAQALVEQGLSRDRVHFVGGIRGNEGALVADAGFSIDLLPGRGIQRRLTVENLGSIVGLLRGLVKGLGIVAKRKPRAVLCLGGYAAFAVSAAAVLLRIPLVVTEQNARASAVNRLFGRFATSCAIPFPGTDLPDGVLTGNPIRPAIVEAVAQRDPAAARRALLQRYDSANPDAPSGIDLDAAADLDRRALVAVWAGSLGATRINDAVVGLSERWADRSDVLLYHVVGRRDWATHGGPRPAGSLPYLRVEYEDHMPDLLVAADVALCRGGASTVTELAVAGLPAILVPLPHAPRDHQRANTAEIEGAGGAIVIDDAEVTSDRLADLLEPLIDDRSHRNAMAKGARSVARPDAAADVARLLLDAGGMHPGDAGAHHHNHRSEP